MDYKEIEDKLNEIIKRILSLTEKVNQLLNQ